MIKYILTALWAVVCAVVLLFGHMYYTNKIAAHSNDTERVVSPVGEEPSLDTEALLAMAKNWPDSAKEQFQKSMEEKKKFKIVFVGTNEMDGWGASLSSKLVDSYGEDVVDVSFLTLDTTTKGFIDNKDQLTLVSLKPGLVVFEPFLINDNDAMIQVKDTLTNVTKIMDDVKAEVPNATFMLQPSNQLYNAHLYPLQVRALKDFAAKNNIAYINHLEAWPDTTDIKVKDYLGEDGGPNEKGNELWLKYLSDFLIVSN